jgi:predicted lipase
MTFNLPLAIRCAKAIEELYAGHIPANIVCPRTDTQVLVEKMQDGHFAVIFPGTASRRDVLTDVRVRRIGWMQTAAKVHRGFNEAYAAVRAGITAMLPPGCKIIIAGHSLGGALATLCAADLDASHAGRITNVFTYGAPRCGNGRFVGEYSTNLAILTARIVNAGDPIPHIPWLFGCYRHVDTQVYLPREGGVRIDEPLAVAVAEAAEKVRSVANNLQTDFISVDAHAIRSYRNKLETLASA